VGINVDLAPVLDVAKDPARTVLGQRIISSDPEVVSRIGCACIEGLQTGGCLSIAKHFPGHGATATDSHKATPVVKKDLAALRSYELLPFEGAVAAGVDGIMLAHILYPEIDPDYIASQSEIFMTDLLRTEMGFEGVILADDFRMNGLRSKAPLGQAAVRFIQAGGDIILCGANHEYQRAILKGLADAVADGTISQARLDESVVRVLTAKMKVSDWTP
jgi:beta-N-acetylhexosaminidase